MDFEVDSPADEPQEPTRRKRGGQPGNLNALKHGHYSQRLQNPEADANLEREITLMRTLVQRISKQAEDPEAELDVLLKTLNTIGAAIDRLARVLKVQKALVEATLGSETNISAEEAILQAISEVAKEMGIQ
jgi:uncharacterized protein YjcR